MSFAGARRSEKNDGFGSDDAVLFGQIFPSQRQNDPFLHDLLGRLGIRNGGSDFFADGQSPHLL